MYTFLATKAPETDNIFTISLPTQDLTPGTYTNAIVNFHEAEKVATNVYVSDFTVTVITNDNGLINGYFSGTLTDHTNMQNEALVEGLIQDVRIQ